MKNIIEANQAHAEIEEAYKAADKVISDAATAATTALATRVTTAESAIVTNKTNQDAAISSAIANWASDRQYKANQITVQNKTFFLCLKDNIGRDPLTDTAGNWSVFTPGSANDVFANRSPVASDVYPVGVKWWDVSFGADTPLGFLSLGNGAWQFLNQISLSKIRFFGYGSGSTYQSNLNSIKFFKEDGTQIPNNWFVWGASSGLGKPTNGVAYSGQSITGQYNASGWADLEPSSLFDLSVPIAKITASSGYFTFQKLQVIYSNGGIKTFTALGDLSPAPQSRYGDSIAAALGETLTSVKLSDSVNRDPGRITGEAFVSAWNALYQAQPAQQVDITDRMDYTATSTDSIAAGLGADSIISGVNGAAFLRGNSARRAILKQATTTTLGELFTAINAVLTARSLTNITEIAYRRSVSAGWLFYDATDPADAAIEVPSGWYVVGAHNSAEFNIEPLATHVPQIVYYTGAAPDTPSNTATPALGLSTTTKKITHYWDVATLTWVVIAPNLPAHSITEHLTGEVWTNGKPIYRKTWTGTTPNNGNDNSLFTVTGATEIVHFFGRIVNSTNRVADMFGVYSGNVGHGPAAQFYGNDLHWFNTTGDTRWQNGAYVVTVSYTK
ncbi:MAG: hypothetical protein ACRC62_22970 [Microcoleus sp.]